MSCTNAYFGGTSECNALLKNMIGAIIQKKGETWTDATIVDLSTWHTAIASATTANRTVFPLPFLYFENTTDDPEISTAPSGQKSKGSDPIPSGVVYLKSGLAQYLQLHGLKGTEYEFFPFFEDGTFWATRKSDGTLKGLRCSVDTNAGFKKDDANQSFPFLLFFDSYEEFEKIIIVSEYNFTKDDLINYQPVGLDIRVTTDYTGGVVEILALKLGSGDPLTGMAAADCEILKSNATPTVAVTAVTDKGLGYYDLTVKKDNDGTPANLASVDYAILQMSKDDGTNVTYLSNALTFYGGT